MSTHSRWFFGTVASLLLSAIGIAPAFAADELVDRQNTAVATNLELYGGLPTDITVDPTGDGLVVYMTTYTPNGIFYSQNGGTIWQGLPLDVNYGAGKSVVVDPATGVATVAIGDDLITTSDDGTTWTALTDNLVGNVLVGSELAVVDGVLFVAVDNGGVQWSVDGGDTFTEAVVSEGTSNNVISISGNEDGRVYAVVQDTSAETTDVFVSSDNGATWSTLDIVAGGVEAGSLFYDVSVDPLDPNHVVLGSYHPDYNSYHSFNRGTTWTALLNNGNRVGGEEAVFDGVGGLYVGINYTDDASVANPTWSTITTDTPLSSVRGDLYAVDATHPTTIFSNTAMGLAKSEDNGATWVDTIEGISAVKTFSITQANNKDVVWLAANGGLAKTTNFTDEEVDWTYPISPDENGGSIYAVWVKPNDGDTVVTGSSNFLYYTEDGGDTWTQADAPDFTGTVDHIVSSPNDAQTLYAMYVNTSLTEDAYNGGVFVSTDTGKTWTEMDFPITLADGAIAVANSDGEDVVYVGVGPGGSENGIFVYRDGEWTKLDADFNEFYVNDLLVHPQDNRIILASCEAESTVGSLYKTVDAGETWEEVTKGLDGTNHLGAMAAQPSGTTTLYLAGQDGDTGDGMLYKSTDGGDSWSLYYRGKKQEFFYSLLFDALVAGNDRGVFGLKSIAVVTLDVNKSDGKQLLTVRLKDASTKKKLGKRKVTVYRKRGSRSWKVLTQQKTNTSGVLMLMTPTKKNASYKVVWKPGKKDRAEYVRAISSVVSSK